MRKMKFKPFICYLLFLAFNASFIGCSNDDDPIIDIDNNNPIETINTGITKCNVLTVTPKTETGSGATFLWSVTKSASSSYSIANVTMKEVQFAAAEPGEYELKLAITSNGSTKTVKAVIMVEKTAENIKYSEYLYKVYDYFPAFGQFINELPQYKEGDTRESMTKKAEDAIKGSKASMISLGGFGGYVVFGFDHTVVNVEGKRDFRILGNAFWAEANPNPEAPTRGGSCEPGIIMVAYDKNQNGQPDEDEWYEIAGSEYANSKTIKNYEITYYKPDPKKAPVTNENYPWAADLQYIKWTDNQGNYGYKAKNIYHSQSYYPEWIKEGQITFRGTLLPNNAVDESGAGSYWVLYGFDWGYADNAPNNDDESAIDINWAVDKNGKKVSLPGINFVKVYSGVNQEAGWLGETSTEVAGAQDLHLAGVSIATRK